MDLAWLAAVLQPRDVAAHPNFPDPEYDARGPAQLAAVILGDYWLRAVRANESNKRTEEDAAAAAAFKALTPGTVVEGLRDLRICIEGTEARDPARSAALTLVACCAAAELDDFEVCVELLDDQLDRVAGTRSSDGMLIRAALLQQKALRLRDGGRNHIDVTFEAAGALKDLEIAECSEFRTSPGVSWSSQTTLGQIRDSLRDSASTMVGSSFEFDVHQRGISTWQDRVRGPVTSMAVRSATTRAETYAKHVAAIFAQQYSRQSSFGGGSRDLFYSVLAFELLGHGAVYDSRKELALFRLTHSSYTLATADSLRLLRQAGAKTELEWVIRRLRSEGPLDVLSQDARQVLRMRATPERLRSVELQVLRAAAELFAPTEARIALTAALATLMSGGPSDLPGQWELPVLRREAAWVAAVALASVCGGTEEVARHLLREVAESTSQDQLVDQALMQAISDIDWNAVDSSLREEWISTTQSKASILPGVAELVHSRLDREVPQGAIDSSIDALIQTLNAAMRGGDLDRRAFTAEVPSIRERLSQIRIRASRGSHSMGGVNVADLATGMILVGEVEELWDDLTDFLLDSSVGHSDRTPAFERLALANHELPAAVASKFRAHADMLLSNPGLGFFESPLIPYPAALRFLASHGLIDDAETFDKIAMLTGLAGDGGRREAARTAAVVSSRRPRPELLALTLPLTHDEDVEVRANAAVALAALGGSDSALAPLANRRLRELLDDDGVLVPVHVLRAMQDVNQGLSGEIRQQVNELASRHPARSVRLEAGNFLHRTDPLSATPEGFAEGDEEYLRQLPDALREVGSELLREVRKRWPGQLQGPLSGRFVESPDNFWAVRIQPRDKSLRMTVRGEAQQFAGTEALGLKDDRRGYSTFKLTRLEELDLALSVLARARRR